MVGRTWSERSYAEALRSSPIGVALVAPDGRWVWANPSLCAILGRTADEVMALTFQDVTHPDDLEIDARLADDVLAGRRDSYQMVKRYLRPDGTEVPVLLSVTLVRDQHGEPEHFVSQIVDLTEERRAHHEARRLSNLQFESVVTGLGLGSFTRDPSTGSIEVNDTFATLYGLDPEQPVTFEVLMGCIHPDDLAQFLEPPPAPASRSRSAEHRFRIVRPDGSIRYIRSFTLRSDTIDGHDGGHVSTGVVIDETDQLLLLDAERAARADVERVKDALAHQALHDPLTGLPNRQLLLDRLHHALSRRVSGEHQAVLLFVDLDRFKVVNDSLGHAAGDRVLVEAARRLRAAIRPEDLVARLGGDEFVVLIEDAVDVDAVAERIVEVLRQPFDIGGHRVPSSASVGVAVATRGSDAGTLLRDADAAMYVAKERGRGRVVRFDVDIHTAALARLELGSAIEGAARGGELVLHYQPAYRADGTMEGIEALVRWQHPSRGLLYPSAFLSLAEELGAVVAVGRWVRAEAARQLVDWRRAGYRPPRVWCNVSVVELSHGGVAEDLVRVCDEFGLGAHDLGIEVTESVLLETNTSSVLDDVSSEGFAVAIDDFGTGYASLAYLVAHRVDVLKIDRRFVARMQEDRPSSVVVRAVVDLARNLGARSIAEGVETHDQHDALLEVGCDAMSGYLLARPVSGEQMLPRLAV